MKELGHARCLLGSQSKVETWNGYPKIARVKFGLQM
jgi:hypothetical protein